MKVTVDLRVLELLSSRLCHELISPVGAINNGIELMGEDDPDFVAEASKLIANSARSAGNRLNFYRFAYGSGRAGTGREVALGLLEGGKARCDWSDAVSALSVEWQRLACNMVVLAAEALPRGGSIAVAAVAGKPGLSVKAAGETVNLAAEMRAALGGTVAVADLTAITGQKPLVTKSRKAIASFKIRAGLAVGAKVTLRGNRMYEFLDRLISIAMPRIRDFRGVSPRSFDGRGNYSLGVKEQIIFPEIQYDQIDQIRGMDITITTTARDNRQGRALLEAFNFPFRK